MDEPGSGIPVILPPDLIIEASRSLPLWLRARDWLLTAAVWVVYFWLISDTFSYLHYLFQSLSYSEPVPADFARFTGIFATLQSYVLVIIMNAAILVIWALYNRIRFRGRERRKFSPAVTLRDLARLHDVPVSDVAAWQLARILVIHHDGAGKLARVEIKAPPAVDVPAAETI